MYPEKLGKKHFFLNLIFAFPVNDLLQEPNIYVFLNSWNLVRIFMLKRIQEVSHTRAGATIRGGSATLLKNCKHPSRPELLSAGQTDEDEFTAYKLASKEG